MSMSNGIFVFLAITFFPDEEIFLNSCNSKRIFLTVKSTNKKDRSSCSFRRKQSLIRFDNLSSQETLLVQTAHTRA